MIVLVTGLLLLFEVGLLIFEPSAIKVGATVLAAAAFGFCVGLSVAVR
jgi:hypothetical protein